MSKAETTSNTSPSDASTSRRAVLRVGGALTAGLLLPLAGAKAFASSDQPTPIQKLWQEREAFLPEVERIRAEYKNAEGRFDDMTPAPPDQLRVSEFHAHIGGLKPFLSVWMPPNDEAGMVIFVTAKGWRHAVERPLVPAEEGPFAAYSWVTQHRAKARNILPIAERYEATVEEARVASGYSAASEAHVAAQRCLFAIEGAIVAATAETFADLLVQAKLCEACGYADHDGDPDNDDAGIFPDYVGRALLRSIKTLAAKANA